MRICQTLLRGMLRLTILTTFGLLC